MGIPHLKIGNTSPEEIRVVEEIQAPRDSTFTALVPDTKITQLLKHIEGQKWPVCYYGSVLNSQSPVTQFDQFEVDLSRSYVEIKNCQLRVSSALDYDYEDSTGISRVTGSAILPYHITPNAGDFFIAAIDSGEDALFIVNRVSRLTQRKETVYAIDYFMYAYLNDDLDVKNAIPRRVSETYYFDDFVDSRNRNVLLSTQDYNVNLELRRFLHESRQFYFDVYRQENTGTYSIPNQREAIIDPLLINFIKSTVDVSKFYVGKEASFNFPSPDYKLRSIWDTILKRRHTPTGYQKEWGFISSSQFVNRAIMNSPMYLFVDYVLHPLNPDRTRRSDTPLVGGMNYPEFDVRNENHFIDPSLVTSVKLMDGECFIPLLPKMFEEGYVVTDKFYTLLTEGLSDSEISYFEILLKNFVTRGQIDPKELLLFSQTWVQWSPLHQLYYLPVLWYIIKVTLGVV